MGFNRENVILTRQKVVMVNMKKNLNPMILQLQMKDNNEVYKVNKLRHKEQDECVKRWIEKKNEKNSNRKQNENRNEIENESRNEIKNEDRNDHRTEVE